MKFDVKFFLQTPASSAQVSVQSTSTSVQPSLSGTHQTFTHCTEFISSYGKLMEEMLKLTLEENLCTIKI